MSQIITTTTATKTDRGVTRMCGMQTVETSIERSGREDTREDARKQGGTQLVGRSIERSGEWVMKGDGLWEANTTHAVSQRQDKWEAPSREEFAHYGTTYGYETGNYGDQSHYGHHDEASKQCIPRQRCV